MGRFVSFRADDDVMGRFVSSRADPAVGGASVFRAIFRCEPGESRATVGRRSGAAPPTGFGRGEAESSEVATTLRLR